LLQTSFPAQLDIQSPGAGYESQPEISAPATLYDISRDIPIDQGPYSTHQDGHPVAIGVLRNGFYVCQHEHLRGLCEQVWNDPEELQLHFELAHFSFIRNNPAHRYICFVCKGLNNYDVGLCLNCGTNGPIELWIYGTYIRTPSYPRQSSDGHDSHRFINPPGSCYQSSSFTVPTVPNMDFQWDRGMNDGNFGGGTNQGQFDFRDGNAYGGPGSQGYGYDPSNASGSGSNNYQGNMFGGARQMRQNSPFTFRVLYAKAQQRSRGQTLFLVFLLLLILTLFSFTHDWVIAKAKMGIPRAAAGFRNHLPMMGFVGIVASFAICLSMKHLAVQRVRRARCVSITVILDDLAYKCTDDTLRDLVVLCMLLRILLSRSSAGQHQILISAAKDIYDKAGPGMNDLMLMPLTSHDI